MFDSLFTADRRRRINHLLSGFGLRDKGFFTPYNYGRHVDWETKPYPHILSAFESDIDGFKDFLRCISKNEALLRASIEDPAGPNWNSSFISRLDGAAIYSFLEKYRPKQVIEIGSGNSTHFMTRAICDHALDTKVLCIDPMPRTSIERLPVSFRKRLLSVDDLGLFSDLNAGDLVFVDSSHILQQGFDVDILFNWIFPILKPGVFVHVHDIFLPYGYPANWKAHRFNEQLALIGWLTAGYFKVIFPCHFVWRSMRESLKNTCPGLGLDGPENGGSLWMVKN